MKILILFNDYLEAGGERQSVATEIKALKDAGVEVDSWVLTNDELSESGPVDKVRSLVDNRAIKTVLAQRIERFSPDIVHGENLFPQFGSAAIDTMRHQNMPWVRTIRNYRKGCIAGSFERSGAGCTLCSGDARSLHGVIHNCYRGSRSASAAATFLRARDSSAERRHPPNAYIAVSNSVRSRIQSDLVEGIPIHTVYNAVSGVGRLEHEPLSRRFDACFVGRFTREKGIYTAVELAARGSMKFAFVGTGPEEQLVADVAGKYPDRIVYFGGCGREETMNVIESSKVLVVPSQWEEPFGRVAAEALSVGTLPLVSDRGGLPEVVAGLDYTAVVPTADHHSWCKSVQAILNMNQTIFNRHSIAAQDLWSLRFSERALATRLIEVYEDVLKVAG